MAMTRSPDYPPEIANLVAVFNQCADGHDAGVVMNASLHMLAAAIGAICKHRGLGLPACDGYTDNVVAALRNIVHMNWDRTPQPGDVPVKLG